MKVRSSRGRHFAVGLALFVLFASSPGTVSAKQTGNALSFRVNSGFLSQRDGFSFANWTSNPQRGTGIQLLIQLFGRPSICTNASSNDLCIPFQSAEQFAAQVEDQLATGRCEGLTVLAAKIHAEGGTPASLVTAESVSQNVDFWWATQMLPAVTAKSRQSRALKPSQLVGEIRQGILQGSTSTLGMYFQNVGHTVLPIAMEKKGSKVTVQVYDSNTPEITQTLRIDLRKEVWAYTPVDKTGKILFTWQHKGAGALDVIPLALRTPQETRYFSLSSITE